MMNAEFDKYARAYDSWFMDNMNVLMSEAKLVAHFLDNAGDVFSVGCGSGLFEMILERDFNISIKNGIEPSSGMADIARKRGMSVEVATAEEADFGVDKYDTILFNGTPSYINDLGLAVKKAYDALKKGGKIILIDVPKESSYGLLYNLALSVGTWDHPLLEGVKPKSPCTIEFVKVTNWRTTQEKVDILHSVGFSNLQFPPTLTKHHLNSGCVTEEPIEGFDSGDYVAICAYKL